MKDVFFVEKFHFETLIALIHKCFVKPTIYFDILLFFPNVANKRRNPEKCNFDIGPDHLLPGSARIMKYIIEKNLKFCLRSCFAHLQPKEGHIIFLIMRVNDQALPLSSWFNTF